jgi:hypothetical protein
MKSSAQLLLFDSSHSEHTQASLAFFMFQISRRLSASTGTMDVTLRTTREGLFGRSAEFEQDSGGA